MEIETFHISEATRCHIQCNGQSDLFPFHSHLKERVCMPRKLPRDGDQAGGRTVQGGGTWVTQIGKCFAH